MSDNFEKFVRTNRRDFDTETPPAQLWDRIEKTLPAEKPAKRFTLRDIYKWSAAAAILFITLTSVYFLFIRKNSHEGSKTNDPVVTVNLADKGGIAPEYAAEFKEVYRSIGEREKELKIATAGQPELYQQFRKDISALDSSFQTLMKQAENSPNRDLIIKAMIQNLRLQAELLSRQLMISTEFNNTKSTKTSKT